MVGFTFEGMKAYKDENDAVLLVLMKILLFKSVLNGNARFQKISLLMA
jgi:hypothetical protein